MTWARRKSSSPGYLRFIGRIFGVRFDPAVSLIPHQTKELGEYAAVVLIETRAFPSKRGSIGLETRAHTSKSVVGSRTAERPDVGRPTPSGSNVMRNAFLFSAVILWSVVSARVYAGDAGEDFDWSRYAEEQTITAITTADDGSARETTIWIVVVDGDAFIRTGNTRWGANVERQPDIALRIADEEIPVRVHFVTDDTLRGRVSEAFRAKYGLADRLLSPFRGGRPKIMHLSRRGER
jgi:hypothetical protein